MEGNKKTYIGKKLVIISHTEHFLDAGVVKGWAPTINEIDYLADYWEEVVHLACLHVDPTPQSAIRYNKKNIRFVALPTYGGKSFSQKMSVVTSMPVILKIINNELSNADYVQLRLPTAMGVYLLPFFAWFKTRSFKFWVKYAGNWDQSKPAFAYRIQRWFLTQNFTNCAVTINGRWPKQPKHCVSFENPCLNKDQLETGLLYAQKKQFYPPFKLVFVGRLENSKGVSRILNALNSIDVTKIKEIVFIGDGTAIDQCKSEAKRKDVAIRMTGFLDTAKVHNELMDAHFLLLPSDSEGFPKVIAEAANYGCIPIVSDVSCIGHYINHKNGYLWDIYSNEGYAAILNRALCNQFDLLMSQKSAVATLTSSFTFLHYLNALKKLIFKIDD
jgi:glycosyltransferase involved in cell wall biosynthesis